MARNKLGKRKRTPEDRVHAMKINHESEVRVPALRQLCQEATSKGVLSLSAENQILKNALNEACDEIVRLQNVLLNQNFTNTNQKQGKRIKKSFKRTQKAVKSCRKDIKQVLKKIDSVQKTNQKHFSDLMNEFNEVLKKKKEKKRQQEIEDLFATQPSYSSHNEVDENSDSSETPSLSQESINKLRQSVLKKLQQPKINKKKGVSVSKLNQTKYQNIREHLNNLLQAKRENPDYVVVNEADLVDETEFDFCEVPRPKTALRHVVPLPGLKDALKTIQNKEFKLKKISRKPFVEDYTLRCEYNIHFTQKSAFENALSQINKRRQYFSVDDDE